MTLKVVVDTDIGDDIDDAFALALACLSPELEVVAVTTVYGDVKARAELATRLLNSLGRDDIPVALGASKPILGVGPSSQPTYYRALKDEGRRVKSIEDNALDVLEKLVKAGEVDVLITLGPMTNAALFLLKRPDLAEGLKLVSMGGAYFMNTAEYNVKCDPEAASILVDSNCEKVLVGLDVTLKCLMKQEMIEALRAADREHTRVLWSYTQAWMEASRHLPILHDPLAVAVAFERNLVEVQPAHVKVELTGRYTRGYTVIEKGDPNAVICKDVNVEKFLNLFTKRVLG